MTEKLDLVRGSGNVFRDLGSANADIEQLKTVLAARIIRILDARKLTVRAAAAISGNAAADFSRIRNARLDRFTIDRLMTMLSNLGEKIEVQIRAGRSKLPPRKARKAA